MYSFAILAAAALASSQFKTFEQFQASPGDWKIVSDADERSLIDLKIAIKNSNMDHLVSKLYSVSDPKSESYGQHLTKQQIDSLVAPSSESFEQVKTWLASAGITEIHVSGDFISATITVAKAQEILNTKYSVYESDSTRLIRTESYSLPEDLHQHVDFVQPTTMFSKFHEAPIENSFTSDDPNVSGALAGCANRMTIQCLNTLYNMQGYVPSGKTKIGVTGYLGQYANSKDLSSFMTKYYPSASKYDFEFQSVSNGTNPQDPGSSGVEAALDIQYVVGLTYPSKSIFYSTAGSPPFIPDSNTQSNSNEPYLDWLIYMSGLSDDEIPSVVTTSYGDNEQTVPFSYASRVCNEFAKLGARGVSVIFSSGDGGVSGGQSGDCTSNDGTNTKKFLPTFPASCPFVTSVGGTTQIPEKAVDFSSGGFSNYFSRPAYQNGAVSGYLNSIGNLYAGLYNTTGRGIPDVAAYGTQFQVYVNGFLQGVAGTSASAPAFAGVIANLNDKLGRKLGFLNPWIYSKGYASLNDITTGSNPGCGTNGFAAAKGWDPVTGYGTPDFKKMADSLTK